MADLLSHSARFIDEGLYEGPASVNPMTGQLSEIGPGIAMVAAFSHVVSFDTGDGLVLFDTSLDSFAEPVLKALRGWSDAPVHTIAYTHGHVDHVGGAAAIVAEARERGRPRPRVVGHAHVPPRFDRYQATNGYNAVINDRQFRASAGRTTRVSTGFAGVGQFGPKEWIRPDTVFDEGLHLRIGDIDFQLHHAKGETDDHLWAWLPQQKAICAGDFLTWVFPNAGNPQKVQRYPGEWAAALRAMIAREPELILPAHGLPIAGKARIATVLGDLASALEGLLHDTLAMMNAGARLNDILHTVKVPDTLLQKPYLRPVYDEPEFVVRNIWRLYGGWYDGNPASLKPARDGALAAEVARLAGGAGRLATRAQELAAAGDLRLACHLAELAGLAAPEDAQVHAARRDVYAARRSAELSLMAKGIYGYAAEESARIAEGGTA